MASDENLVVTDTNTGGTAQPQSGATDQCYKLVDNYASGRLHSALPAGSYTYVLQTITYHPNGAKVRVSCIANLVSNVTVTELTTNPNPNANCQH